MLVNGQSGSMISIRDRGLLYGDGVFRTMRAVAGRVGHWSQHLRKLQDDCSRLGMDCPSEALLRAELEVVLAQHPDGVIKLIVTRGEGVRGYAPTDCEPTRIWDVSSLPDYPVSWATQGIKAHLCELRLSIQPRLAGIKHLSRLESVLAAAELRAVQASDHDVAEALLLDAEGRLIEGMRSNLFLVSGGRLITPSLVRCGVEGVQRERVMRWAKQSGMAVDVRDVMPDEAVNADELFVVNSLIGLWPVREFAGRRWGHFPVGSEVRWFLERDEE